MRQYHKNVEPFFIATNARSLANHCKARMISAKTNTLLFTEKHLLRLFYTRRVSDLHAPPATRKATHTLRACSHWEPVTHSAWFLQNKLSIIHGIQYTKIIQHLQSLIYSDSTRVSDKLEGRQCMGQANRNNSQSTSSSYTNFSPYRSICKAP